MVEESRELKRNKEARLTLAITLRDRCRVERAAKLMGVTKSKLLLGAVKFALDQIEKESGLSERDSNE